jgi:hypothetical protein
MRSHLYGAIAIAAMIATPAMAQTTTPHFQYHEHAGARRRDEHTDIIS